MPERDIEGRSLRVRPGQPLIGVVVRENGQTVTRFYTDRPADLHRARTQRRLQRASALAGAWKDLDWDEMEEALDRIRHQSEPTPSIDEV